MRCGRLQTSARSRPPYAGPLITSGDRHVSPTPVAVRSRHNVAALHAQLQPPPAGHMGGNRVTSSSPLLYFTIAFDRMRFPAGLAHRLLFPRS